MVELTVGVVSAFIAAGIAVLQFLLPNALALVLAGNLSDTHSAVTWSVASRFFLSSDWPLFLRSDSAASTAVSRRISLVTWVKPVGLFLAAAAAVVTPLGLHDGILPSQHTEIVSFVYAVDPGAIGTGTPARNNDLGFSRVCSDILCPGERDLGNVTVLQYINQTYSRPINDYIRCPELPESLVDIYQSGLTEQMSSVSGFFDIQFRQWGTGTTNWTVDNSSYLTPSSKMLTSLVLDDKYDFLEGLITNYETGGIAFRNHSVPVGLQYGAEWEEDLLWWEPEVQCVDTNLSLTMTAESQYTTSYQGLVDRGGFVNLNRTHPYPTQPGDDYVFPDGQGAPSIYERAYLAAWGTNVLSMEYLNITTPNTSRARISSQLGQRFEVNSSVDSYSPTDWSYLSRIQFLSNIVNPPSEFNLSNTQNPRIPNPYDITEEMFVDHISYCKGHLGGDKVNISLIDMEIGMVAAPAHRTDGGDVNNMTPNSTWERPLFVCAAATKASFKTFTFRYNTTADNSLSGLYIASVKDKEYSSESEKPLWAFEAPSPPWNLSLINPLWGLVDDSHANTPNLSTVRSPHFYIPASYESAFSGGMPTTSIVSDYLAGITAPPMLWYETSYSSSSNSKFDYSGRNNLPLQLRWQELSKNTTGVSLVLKLIWTDFATNFVTGTKGIHTPRYQQPGAGNAKRAVDAGELAEGQFPVHVMHHRIRYHWYYAIPALLCISVVGLAVFMAFVSMVCGHGTVERLRHFMFNSTSGRVLASFVYPDGAVARDTDTKEWIRVVGHRPVQIFGQVGRVGQATGVEYQPHGHGVSEVKNVHTGKAQYVEVQQQEEGDSAWPLK